MVDEAEAAKEEDQRRKETIELKNESDSMIYNTEKQLNEHADKIPQGVKDQVQTDITQLNEAITTEDNDKIRESLERLKNSSMEIGKAIYQENSQQSEQTEEQQQEEPQEEKAEEEKKEEKKE